MPGVSPRGFSAGWLMSGRFLGYAILGLLIFLIGSIVRACAG